MTAVQRRVGRRSTVTAGTVAALAAAGYWTTMSSQSQLLGPFPSRAPGEQSGARRIALTFDDGPNEPFTSRLAALLQGRGVRATFFQVGKAVARAPEVSAALVAAGHVVGNHSYSHEFRRCFTAAAVEDEVRRAQDVLADTLQRRPGLYRPPWLVRTPATLAILHRQGLVPISGTFCHPFEVAGSGGARIAGRAVARSAPGRILIFHDGFNGTGADRTRTLDAVERVVDTLAGRGWSFTTVDALLGVDAYGEN